MSNSVILYENGFSLAFHTRNNITPSACVSLLTEQHNDGFFVLQEKIIAPPDLLETVAGLSAHNLFPDRCNPPLVLAGHPDLPLQYSALVARTDQNNSRIQKNSHSMQVCSDGMNCLFSAPLYSGPERTERAMFSAFEAMRAILSANRMDASDLVRTWLYMDDCLAGYEYLNLARERFFREISLPEGYFYPASTGIEGQVLGNRPMSLEFCAFSGDNLSIQRLVSPLQDEPTAYGKLFSRAMMVRFPGNKLLFISGTAAIDRSGASVFKGDVKRQLGFTLEIISAILKEAGGDLSSVAQAIVYLKKNADLAICLSILSEEGFPNDRALFQVNTSVCREELLCEIEVTAII